MRRTESRARGGCTAALFAALGLLLAGTPAGAGVPEILSYQGVLTLPDGSVAQDGSYTLEFAVVDDQDVVRHQEQIAVELRGGLYSVLLGGQGGLPLSQVFDDAPRFMDVRIVSGAEPGVAGVELPRQVIAPVPYALRAARAETPLTAEEPVPAGMLVLWDQPTGCDDASRTCPCGWSEAPEFAGIMIRGADTTQRWDEIPDAPGISSGSPTATGTYGDTLTAAEAPEHSHIATQVGNHTHSLPDIEGFGSGSAYVNNRQDFTNYSPSPWSGLDTAVAGNHGHQTHPAGGGEAHFHPSYRVLFCRKD